MEGTVPNGRHRGKRPDPPEFLSTIAGEGSKPRLVLRHPQNEEEAETQRNWLLMRIDDQRLLIEKQEEQIAQLKAELAKAHKARNSAKVAAKNAKHRLTLKTQELEHTQQALEQLRAEEERERQQLEKYSKLHESAMERMAEAKVRRLQRGAPEEISSAATDNTQPSEGPA